MPNPIKLLCILYLMLFTVATYGQKTTPVQINDVKFRLPSEWKRIPEADWQEGGQYGFEEKNTEVIITISARKAESMEFYKPGMNEWQLVDTFYKWDAEYWNSDKGINATVKKLKEDTTKKIIFWSLEIKQGENIFMMA